MWIALIVIIIIIINININLTSNAYLAIASEHPSFQKFPISKSVRGDELVRPTYATLCSIDYQSNQDQSVKQF